MLELKNIVKDYPIGNDTAVHALKNICIEFPNKGFISILGHSGCGKTTLLNIIGGLDRYTSGDLLVDGVSTKKFTDRDWDNYRNKRIGMVFQSYNLIGHMSVIGNVELAMTLSGIGKAQRRAAAKTALKAVGLESEINKRPNQLSGGQMQRVAIARAIVNNPGIILADEPTGALDSVTSIQILDILANVARTKLVIMVTHNRELAFTYATRIIEMSDGNVLSDKPNESEYKYDATKEPGIIRAEEQIKKDENGRKEKTAMSFVTALSISGQNLKTKKARTILTSIAGSFGIIGVAMVLALSNGFTNYVNRMQSETLANFPISIEQYWVNTSSLVSSTKTGTSSLSTYPTNHEVVVRQPLASELYANDISDNYVAYIKNIDPSYVSSVQYNYALKTNILTQKSDGSVVSINSTQNSYLDNLTSSSSYWYELPSSKDFVLSQYDLVEGDYPSKSDEVVLIVDKYNSLYSTTLNDLGYDSSLTEIPVSKILSHKFKAVPNNDYYTKNTSTTDETGFFLKSTEELDAAGLKLSKLVEYYASILVAYQNSDTKTISSMTEKIASYFNTVKETRELNSYSTPSDSQLSSLYNGANGTSLNVVGILRPKKETVQPLLSSGIYYTSDLVTEQIDSNSASDIAISYKNNLNYSSSFLNPTVYKIIGSNDVLTSSSTTTPLATYISQRKILGTDVSVSSITIYPKNFDEKQNIINYLDDWNKRAENKDNNVKYMDLAGTVTSALENMVNIISYVLIAFASISLLVSSVMIGIITYTSVIERTKEIGILRAIGARKKDVSRLFKAEAVIIGFLSGTVGIIVAYLACIPINQILSNLYPAMSVGQIASLSPWHALLLIVVSMVLTFVSALIPSHIASKKDPVVSLRTE
jgi:putative ABC transport system permease protein